MSSQIILATDNFVFAVTRDDALEALNRSLKKDWLILRHQDAMTSRDPWLFHSHLYVPKQRFAQLEECIELAEKAFYESKAPINFVEGFIRQILVKRIR